ncbi:uroporphyrinogen-III synthase [Corallococcus praedator]|uniref:Uroporphyrinogen-III synthase n=1 Tax=Corallococcus praedator TaxID=2316724 RepID=A0ABX9QLQ0_9BACT|nr:MULTISPECIES: uroporphyrinogen-III synthase [Corallococcus]RKH19982.1 uroporphyrinogen-III synthase [Corallococcus sp. CA047B]RKH34517.1 uroporphyrinogen-III synthase [Corallococcus sp. CA031C]RKI10258.1 uroporphyrinogen-III synthase [Corallococcus praedator]
MDRRLEGIRVLVTRPRERAEELCFLLEDEGADVFSLPLLELRPPEDPRPLASAAEHVQRYHWVVFASPSAVESFLEALRLAGTLDRLSRVKLAAVGPRTARTVEAFGLTVAAEPTEGTGVALFTALRDLLGPDDDVLLPSAEEGRRELEDGLRDLGVRVTRVTAYRSTPAPLPPEALAHLSEAPPQVVLFASPRTAEAFLEGAGREPLASAKVVAIGPTTATALGQLGIDVATVAERPTPEALVDATVRAVHG